ncbi:hypothetical protein [Phenylobacterium sp.]|jgi:hypothetical protein|uniref:hypothetical protein n=1 Tax=Phenylobacterium sp. TaxID=1871053 RepID=UPI002F414983
MRNFVFATGLVFACLAASAHAQGYSPAAKRVLAQARAASGGAGWDYLRGWHETGHEGGAPYERWFDTLRYGMRIETREAGGVHVRGFNGQGEWQILPNGAKTGGDERVAVAKARTSAFLGAYGFFYPGRFDARGEYVGVRAREGRPFEVVSVKPWGGEARELWFDKRSHLLGLIVDRAGPNPVIVQLSDYRRVGALLVPYRITVAGAAPDSPDTRQVESVAFTPPDRNLFSLPRPPGAPAAGGS